jgi:enoyl-CoA hydratase/carnithine racemase
VTAYETIRYERSGHIGTLTLARPENRNAQNPLMWQELADLGSELLADDTLRCMVVMGEGPSFSSARECGVGATAVEPGLDVRELVANVAADPVAGRAVPAAPPAVHRRHWNREIRGEILWAQHVIFPRGDS